VMENISGPENQSVFEDPVFVNIFLPLYKSYKTLDREFDRKVIDKDLENLRKKLETIAVSKLRRNSRE
jgi:hypothetical protein